MSDLMKKRLIGVAVLILVGISIPVILSRLMAGGGTDNGSGSMRVYDVQPNGQVQRASRNAGHQSASTGDQGSRQSRPHAPVSGQAASANRSSQPADGESRENAARQGAFSTPPVHGGNTSHDNAGIQAESSSGDQENASGRLGSSRPHATGTPGDDHDSSAREAKTEKPAASESSGSLEHSGQNTTGWTVQVASFGDEKNARRMAERLKKRFKAYYRSGDVHGKTYYRVRIGPFDNENAARKVAGELRDRGKKPLVTHQS